MKVKSYNSSFQYKRPKSTSFIPKPYQQAQKNTGNLTTRRNGQKTQLISTYGLRQNRTQDQERPHEVLSRMQRIIDDAHYRNQSYCNKKRETYHRKIGDINNNLGVLSGPMPRPVYWRQVDGPLRPSKISNRKVYSAAMTPERAQFNFPRQQYSPETDFYFRRKQRDCSRFSHVSLQFESPDRQHATVDLDLSEILQELDCEMYEPVFRDQGIETADFFLLKQHDLKELQLPLGARNRIIAYWESLRECPQEVAIDPSKGILNNLQSRYFKGTLHGMPLQRQTVQEVKAKEQKQLDTTPVKKGNRREAPLLDPKQLRLRYEKRMQDLEEIQKKSQVQQVDQVLLQLKKAPSSKDQVKVVSSQEEEELRSNIPEMEKHPSELDEVAKKYSEKLLKQANGISQTSITPETRPSPMKTPDPRFDQTYRLGNYLTPGMSASTSAPSPSFKIHKKTQSKNGVSPSKVLWKMGRQLNKQSRENLRTIVQRKVREHRYDIHCGIHRDREWQHQRASQI